MAILEGLAIGLGTILFIGPVFFTLLNITLEYRRRAGATVALGIIASDMVCIALSFYGALKLFQDPANQKWLALVGAAILLFMAVKFFLIKEIEERGALKLGSKHYTSFFMKGFLVNLVNPFVFMVWIGIIGYGQSKYGTSIELALLLASVLFAIFSTDLLKVILAHRIKQFMNPRTLFWVHRIIAVILAGFSIRLLVFASNF